MLSLWRLARLVMKHVGERITEDLRNSQSVRRQRTRIVHHVTNGVLDFGQQLQARDGYGNNWMRMLRNEQL